MPSMRVSFNPPVDGGMVDLKGYKRDLFIMIEEAAIKAARDVYTFMVDEVPVWSGFSQGAVSNLAGASIAAGTETPGKVDFKGNKVGNPDKGGKFGNSLTNPIAQAKLKTAKDNKLVQYRRGVTYREKNFTTGKQYATAPASILTFESSGILHFKFKVDIGYWLATSPKDNAAWGELSQYRDHFITQFKSYFKPPGIENYINSRIFKGRKT